MQITKLKIDSNPFAKGFRDSSRLSDFERETMENMFESQFLRTQQVLKKKYSRNLEIPRPGEQTAASTTNKHVPRTLLAPIAHQVRYCPPGGSCPPVGCT